LHKSIAALTEQAKQELELDDQTAFKVAMAAIRQFILPHTGEAVRLPSNLRRYAARLATNLVGRISFANVPAEAVAELYERFAVSPEARRRRGVVYTPAWLARYVVDRMPSEAFATGETLDATCGSGTFLVCALERIVERARRDGKVVDASLLQRRVRGIDLDPVAIEAAKLSLDLFAAVLGVTGVTWNLAVDDATTATVTSEWLVGNLPFGHRTFEGHDLSSEILAHIHESNPDLRALCLIVPDSLAYAKSERARVVRTLLRSNYTIEEVTRLPERVFEGSTAATMVIAARKGPPAESVLVRQIRAEDLSSFRAGLQLSTSFYTDLPSAVADPWSFSPFSNEFEAAARKGQELGSVATTWVGLQTYGMNPSLIGPPKASPKQPLLSEPTEFAHWRPGSIRRLPSLRANRNQVRRAGPWDEFQKPKVIVRTTTDERATDRLAAIPDAQGLWFTDKFAGIWPTEAGGLGIRAIAAYLQTRFARVWFQTNNPSRKLRLGTLLSLPVPKLPAGSWERAAELAPLNRVVRPPKATNGALLRFNGGQEREWAWFNASVDAALGLDPVSSSRLDEWIVRKGGVGEADR
jgi:hypothetical protein